MVATTDYESPFPSGIYEPNIQSERRTSSPTTVAGAQDHNRHDVEIRRIEEVLGAVPVPGTGDPAVPGSTLYTQIYQNYVNIYNVLNSGLLSANKVPISDQSDANYDFVKWFLEWMLLWDKLSSNDTEVPNTLEVVKALWQNKYDVEILFDPVFIGPCTASGADDRVSRTLVEDKTVWGGVAGMSGYIGGFCNLNTRPYPVTSIERDSDSMILRGYQTLQSGLLYHFNTDAGTPAAASDYKVGLFRLSPASLYMSQPTGQQPPTGWPPPTGWVPPSGQQPPPNGGGPPGGGIGDTWPPVDDLTFGEPFLPIKDSDGGLELYLADWDVFSPLAEDGAVPTLVVGTTSVRGIDLNTAWAYANLKVQPGTFVQFGVTLTAGSGSKTYSGYGGYAYAAKHPVGGVAAYDGTEDVAVIGINAVIAADKAVTVPIGYYAADPADGPVSLQVQFSDENGSLGTSVWVLDFWVKVIDKYEP